MMPLTTENSGCCANCPNTHDSHERRKRLLTCADTLGRVPMPFLLRSDNGLVFTSRSYAALVRSYGLRQEFITPHCLQQRASGR
jgi:transposase InsO family protein